jgi:hypothetical protein
LDDLLRTAIPVLRIAVADDVEPGEWYDPAFLQRLAPAASQISMAEIEKKARDTRLGGL